MPKKVVLRGDALKLLYTFVDYAKAYPEDVADVLQYNLDGFKERTAQLDRQLSEGKEIDWDDVDEEVRKLKED